MFCLCAWIWQYCELWIWQEDLTKWIWQENKCRQELLLNPWWAAALISCEFWFWCKWLWDIYRDCRQRKHSWPSFFVKFLSFVWWQCSLDFIVHTASNYGLTFVQLRVLSKGNIYTDYQDRWQLLSTIMIITANGHCQPRAFPGLTSAWSLNHSCHWSNTTTLVSSCPLRWKTQTLRLRINNIFPLKFDSNVFCELIYCLFVLTLFPQW